MTLEQALSLISDQSLEAGLKHAEVEVLAEVDGQHNYGHRLLYRMISRCLNRRRRMPEYRDLPRRLLGEDDRHGRARLDQQSYRAIRREMSAVILDAAQLFLSLTPTDPSMTREQRIEQYCRQNSDIERRYKVTKEASREAPVKKPVRCVELGVSFPSTNQAAEFLTAATKRRYRRSDIRTAIRRGLTCGKWKGPLPGKKLKSQSLGADVETALTWQYVDLPIDAAAIAA